MSDSQTTVPQDIPASASELKEKANALYGQKSFAKANDVYRSIIEQYADSVPAKLIRTLRCNRAACFIELGEFQSAIVELDQIFQTPKSDSIAIDEQTDSIFHKAHFRKARCLSELGKDAEALQELDIYRDLVKGNVDEAERHLRAKILSSIGKESTTSGMRPFVYEVQVFGRDDPITFQCTAPAELFVPRPSREAANAFLTSLVKEYDAFVMNFKPGGWNCSKCSKPATSLTHTPTMMLYVSPEEGGPKIIDFVHPVCKNLSPCDMEARKLINEELKFLEDSQKASGLHLPIR